MEIGTIKAYDAKGNEIGSLPVYDNDKAGKFPFSEHVQEMLNEMISRVVNVI